MAKDLICFRLPPDLRTAAENFVAEHGITLSEWCRILMAQALGQGVTVDEGYMQGRALGWQVARALLTSASQQLPSTYAEAIARFGITPE